MKKAIDPDVAVPPLKIPIFRNIWIANSASNFGSFIQSVGAAWMMTSLTRTPAMVALVQTAAALPMMLLALVSGAVADNFDRRRVMLCGQAYMLVISLTLALCTWAGLLTPWLLLTMTFLLGCGVTLSVASSAASVGDMVPRASVPAAVGLNAIGTNSARSLGPAIGGLIVATAGAAAAFTVNALSYFGVLFVLYRWRPNYAARTLPSESLGAAMATGLRYVALSPRLRRVIFRAGFYGLFASGVSALMPLVARDLIGGGARTYGVLLGAFGLGAVGGAMLMRRLRQRLTTESMIRYAILMLATGTAVTSLSRSAGLTAAALLIAGAGWILALSSFNVVVQLAAPRWVVGRAMSCYQMSAFGAMAIGASLVGQLAAHLGVSMALLVVAACQAAGLLLAVFLPLSEVGQVDLAPLMIWSEPQTDLQVDPRSGPIAIAISYRIRVSDIQAFLVIMNERRRIRRRDGAGRWRLMRDMADQQVWVERYEVRTWLDYVRHNQRLTNADAANHQQLLALHIGPERPLISRMIERHTGAMPAESSGTADELDEALAETALGV